MALIGQAVPEEKTFENGELIMVIIYTLDRTERTISTCKFLSRLLSKTVPHMAFAIFCLLIDTISLKGDVCVSDVYFIYLHSLSFVSLNHHRNLRLD